MVIPAYFQDSPFPQRFHTEGKQSIHANDSREHLRARQTDQHHEPHDDKYSPSDLHKRGSTSDLDSLVFVTSGTKTLKER